MGNGELKLFVFTPNAVRMCDFEQWDRFRIDSCGVICGQPEFYPVAI